MRNDPDDFDPSTLRDGESMRVPMRMLDSLSRSVAQHIARRRPSGPKDSAAFPRPKQRPFVTDAQGGTMGLHRPGFRLAAGGHDGDRALRDSERQEVEDAYAAYDHALVNGWKRRDAMAADPGEVEVEARAAAIHNALLNRGHNPDEVEDFLASCDEGDLLDNDVGQHVQAFEEGDNGRDTRTVAVDRRMRLNELYQQRDRELAEQWKRK
jgi:hypothetical protein